MAYICNEMADFFDVASAFVLLEVPDDFDTNDDLDTVTHNIYRWQSSVNGFAMERDGGLVGGSQYFYHEESENFVTSETSVFVDFDIYDVLNQHGIDAGLLHPIGPNGSRSLDLSVLYNIDNIEHKIFGWNKKTRCFSVTREE